MSLLRQYQTRERDGAWMKDNPYQRVDLLRSIAGNQVDLRAFYFTDDGTPDWAGRTWAYRNAIAEVYEAAGIRGSERTKLSATIRYHVGNILRQRLPVETLEEMGLRAASPRERSGEKRDKQRALLSALSSGTPTEPNRDVIRALVTAHTLLSHTEPEPREGTDLVEALHWLDVVGEDLDRLRAAVDVRRAAL